MAAKKENWASKKPRPKRVTMGDVLTSWAKERKGTRRDATRIRDMAFTMLKLVDRIGNPEVQSLFRDNLGEIHRTAERMDARTGTSDPSAKAETKKQRRR